MALKIIAFRSDGGLGNPSKILQVLQDPEQTRREVRSCKFVVYRNEQKDLVLVIGHKIHPLIVADAKPHLEEGYKVDSGGKITYHPVGASGWEAVLGGWSTTYEGPFALQLLEYTREIAKTLGMTMTFRWEIQEDPETGNHSYGTDPRFDLPL